MCRKIIYLFAISIFGINFTVAQSSAQKLLTNIQDKFISIDDLSAVFAQSVNNNVILNGKIYFKKENNLRFEFKNAIIISDGKTSWNYNEKENKVIISESDNSENKIFSIHQLLFEYPKECELSTTESEGKKVLQLNPKTDASSFNSVKLFLSDDYLITKVMVDDPSAGNIQIELSNYKLNTKLPGSYFSFTPPEGCQVIDLR